MDFFNSLSQVAQNGENFKKWEQEQRDNEAQRQALYNSRKYSPEEIEAAKQFGERIIDVVDIMDNHSENVAENVETAVSPVVSLAPLAATLLTGAYWVKKIVPQADDEIWNIKKQICLDNEKAQKLAYEITDDIRKSRPNKEEFLERYFTSKRKVQQIANPELRAKAMEIYKEYSKKVKPYNRKLWGGGIGVVASGVLAFIGATIYAAKLQVDSSKIARYQARKILEDPKAFVNYTPEQIAAAKKYIDEHPELKKQKRKEKLKSGMFKSIINILRDRREYLKAKKTDSDTSKKVTRTLTPDEIVQAKKDKEVIQRSVRLINNEAEKYSENMEVAAGIILGSTPIVGGLCGWLTGVVMNKTGLTDKIVKNIVDKNGSEEAKQAYARFKELKSGAPGYTTRWSKFVNKLMNDDAVIKEAVDNTADNVKLPKKNWLAAAKKLFAAGMSHRWFNSKIIGLIGAFVSAIPAALIALKLQKSSARAGRYTAKRELEKDPRNFIGYTEEDLQEVKDVKGEKQTFGQKLKEYALFVPNVLKQYYAYEKYKRTEFKDHQLQLEQLQKSEVTDEQLLDAKNLQRKLFNTFEKVDDNSQIYSESMEAATEILQPFALSAGVLVAVFPLIYAGFQIGRGKITAASALDWTIKKIAGASNFLKSKTFKKYLKDVSEKIPHKVGNVELQNKPVAALLQGMDFDNDTIGTLQQKLVKNIRISSGKFRAMSDEDQKKLLDNIKKTVKYLAEVSDFSEKPPELLKKFYQIIAELKSDAYTPKLRADMLDILVLNADRVHIMNENAFKDALSKLADLMCKAAGEEKIGKLAFRIARIPDEKIPPGLEELVYAFRNRFTAQIEDGIIFDMKAFKKVLVQNIDKTNTAALFGAIDKFYKKLLSPQNFPYKLKDIPAGIDNIINYFRKCAENTDEIPQTMRLSGNVADDTAEAVNEAGKSVFKKLADPKEYLKDFRKKVEAMSETEFQNKADGMGFSSMDKNKMLSILSNLEKIYDNIPAGELKQIRNSILKELREHPDEFLKTLTSGQLFTSFLTNSVITAAAAAGISWVALNIIINWAIQTWLADMQLKAGRLGVMKAIESLDDPAYYANIIPDGKTSSVQNNSPAATAPVNVDSTANTVQSNFVSAGNLLDKFKNKPA